MRLRRTLAALTAATLVLTGCGNDTPISPQSAGPAATSAAQKAPAPPAVPLDATAVLMKLNAAKIGLTHGAVQDEDTDPNDLLGRPNGYTSRASADLPGGDSEAEKYGIDRGLVIEVWPTADDAERRSKFIQDTLKSMQLLGTEYHYRAASPADGPTDESHTGRLRCGPCRQERTRCSVRWFNASPSAGTSTRCQLTG